jgi:hypothetical protein
MPQWEPVDQDVSIQIIEKSELASQGIAIQIIGTSGYLHDIGQE